MIPAFVPVNDAAAPDVKAGKAPSAGQVADAVAVLPDRRGKQPRFFPAVVPDSPLVHFVWIMGADNLAQFDKWERWREIFTMVPIVVVDRPGWRLKALASTAARAFAKSRKPETDAALLADMPPPAWTFLTGPLSHASSTAIRNRARAVRLAQRARKAPAPESLPWRKPGHGIAAANGSGS